MQPMLMMLVSWRACGNVPAPADAADAHDAGVLERILQKFLHQIARHVATGLLAVAADAHDAGVVGRSWQRLLQLMQLMLMMLVWQWDCRLMQLMLMMLVPWGAFGEGSAS